MSDTNSETPSRQVAQRVFATEFADATYRFTESDAERAPQFQLLPTGEKANRVFVVGTLTEVEDVGTDSTYLQARVVDPTGTFYVYAGKYQREAMQRLDTLTPPAYVAIVGKPRAYDVDDENDDGDTTTDRYVSISPEAIREVDQATRDLWVEETARQTLDRLDTVLAGDDAAPYAELVEREYGDVDLERIHDGVIDALEQLADTDDSADAADDVDGPAEPDDQPAANADQASATAD